MEEIRKLDKNKTDNEIIIQNENSESQYISEQNIYIYELNKKRVIGQINIKTIMFLYRLNLGEKIL